MVGLYGTRVKSECDSYIKRFFFMKISRIFVNTFLRIVLIVRSHRNLILHIFTYFTVIEWAQSSVIDGAKNVLLHVFIFFFLIFIFFFFKLWRPCLSVIRNYDTSNKYTCYFVWYDRADPIRRYQIIGQIPRRTNIIVSIITDDDGAFLVRDY